MATTRRAPPTSARRSPGARRIVGHARPYPSVPSRAQAGREEGVLVLSEFAGAADHLDDGALLVNPYDTQSLADAMHEALSMPLARRQALHRNAYEHVTTSTASTWAAK